ncbi:hypothetical protein ACLB2K_013715 [Fragaria x ananassa]
MEKEVLVWPFGKKNPRPPYKGDEDESRPCWKKKSIFFELEYWKFLPVRHCLDVMHIEKNVCDSLLGTLLNVPGKTKDGIKARLDLVEMGIRTELAPNLDGQKKTRLPLASWNLTLDEKKSVCGCFYCMKVPQNYSSNVHNLVSMDDLRLNGMKSHDCHVLMQQLLPVALRAVLDKPVRVAVIRLCLFFTEICSKSFEVSKLPKIQSDIVETLCLLEKYFPPSFFDIMVHLTIHLVREIELCGPVFYRWMFPFERYMKVCKGYVRNRARPEGCIAENYIAEEAVEFLAERLLSDKTIGIPKQRSKDCRRTSGAKISSIYGGEFKQAHLCVLQNTEEFSSYFLEHMEYLKATFPTFKKNKKWLKDEQNKTFADWVKKRVEEQLMIPENNISETVRWIAAGPCHEVAKFSSYIVDGVQFYTKLLDDVRACQNSGVYLEADTMVVATARDKNPKVCKLSFYGVVDEIWEMDYTRFMFPLFKCDWAESSKGVKVQAFPEETECKLALGSTDHFVALATFCTNDDPSTVCHGYAMGDDKLRVSIHTAIEEKALIPFPVGDEIKTVKQAMGSWVMWPKNLIIYNENKKKASGKVRPKRKCQQHNESEDDKFDFQQLHHLDLPATVKKLCQWGEEGFVVRDSICFYKEEDVFGHRAKSYLMGSDVMRLAKLTPASGGLIVVYMM